VSTPKRKPSPSALMLRYLLRAAFLWCALGWLLGLSALGLWLGEPGWTFAGGMGVGAGTAWAVWELGR
jgi:hypothetical protein